MDHFYFDYALSINVATLSSWCKEAGCPPDSIVPLGPAILPDVELSFDYFCAALGGGLLNIRSSIGQIVNGILFRISPVGWNLLESIKIHPSPVQYSCIAILPDGSCRPTITYVAEPTQGQRFVTPTDHYYNAVRDGLRERGLDTVMLDQVVTGRRPDPIVRGVFVYGTLMRGEERGNVITSYNGGIGVHTAVVRGRLLDLGSYPGLVLDNQGGAVHGEFFNLATPDTMLRQLDEIECALPGCAPGGLYRRTLVMTALDDGREERAWTYVINDPGKHPIIPSGNWRERLIR